MNSYTLLVEPEDINQEVELLRAEGKPRVNRSFVEHKLSRLAYDHLNYDELATTSEGLEPLETLEYEPERPSWLQAQERLVDWALDQTQYVQSVINRFLEDPIENYELTLQALLEAEVIKPESEDGDITALCAHTQPSVTYVSILKKRIKSRPASKEDLIEEMSKYPINRPATTVRQFLRRHKTHLIEEDGLFRWVA